MLKQFSDIMITPTYGPLSTNQYPNAMPPHNLGVLYGRHPNPPQFSPSDNASNFSLGRHEYFRTMSLLNTPQALATKYISPPASSLYTATKRSQAIGKTSYTTGQLSYKAYDKNDVKTALRFVRGGGCTAPKKKGAISNTTLRNGQVCAWGSMVRSKY